MTYLTYLFKALLFALAHYSAIGALAILSYLIGRRLTRSFVYHSRLEQVGFSVSLGLGVIAYLTLFLGLPGWLYSWLLLIALALCAWLCRPTGSNWLRLKADCYGLLKRLRQSNSLPLAIGILAALVLVAPFILLPLYPPLAWDGVMYHLPYAKTYVASHGIVFTPYLRFPVGPQTNEMLFTLALLLYDDILAQLFQCLQMLTLAVAVAALGWRLFSPLTGGWASAILLCNPMLIWLGTCAYVDIGVTLFITMAVYAFWNWLEEKAWRWLILAGVFSGLAVGTKLLALFIPALVSMSLLYLSLKERRLSPLLVFNLIWLLVAAPWLSRSFYYTRNPVYPFFQSLFDALFDANASKMNSAGSLFGASSGHWDGKSLGLFLSVPWKLTFNSPFAGARSAIFQGYFFALPLIFLGSLRDGRLRRLVGFVLAYMICWYCTISDTRFIIPILPILSVATAAALEKFLRYITPSWRSNIQTIGTRLNQPALAAASFVLLITPGWIYAYHSVPGPFPVTSKQRNTVLKANLPSYPAYKLLNELRGKDYTVFTLMESNMTYFTDGLFISALFSPGGYSRIFGENFSGNFSGQRLIEGRMLYQKLKDLDVDYFIVDINNAASVLPEDNFFKERFKLIYQQPRLMLFELVAQPPNGAGDQ